jgi:hypothetical protein
MRCGILVSIRRGKVTIFAPFANASYTNTWSDRLVFSHGSIPNYVRTKALTTRQPLENWLPPEQWWINGGIVCNVMPPGVWGTAHCAELLDMLDAACATAAQPDCDFFINKRDYPQLRRDGSEPYARFTGTSMLTREVYTAYAPVLSFYGGSEFADCVMPLTEDWKRCTKATPADNHKPWEDALPVAIWRGTATGSGVHPHTNVRLRLVAHCVTRSDLYNVALVGYNNRDKVMPIEGNRILVHFLEEPERSAAPLAPYMDLAKQCQAHKYVIYADGHCAANRYGALMESHRVIIRIGSERQTDGGLLWLFPGLTGAHVTTDGTAHVPPNADHFLIAPDLTNLDATIMYLQEHDDVARSVADCAHAKAPTAICIVAAWTELLAEVHRATALAPAHAGPSGLVLFSPYDTRYAKQDRVGSL